MLTAQSQVDDVGSSSPDVAPTPDAANQQPIYDLGSTPYAGEQPTYDIGSSSAAFTDIPPRLDGVVAVTEAGPSGMPARGMTGQPMEPDSVDAADPDDGSIYTVPSPPAMPPRSVNMAADMAKTGAMPQDQADAGLSG